jgi:exodeoxyribonuclease VII large subunit
MKKLSVSELISQIKGSLESDYPSIYVSGEVANLSRAHSGHWYWSLGDGRSSVSVAMFRGDAIRNPEVKTLKEGDKIDCIGGISVYPPRGTFQLIAKRIIKSGKGDLKLQYEKLKADLAAKGLFDLEHKKAIPAFPQKVALVTSATGAAAHDFLKTVQNSGAMIDVVLVPALVQGKSAAQSVIKAIDTIESKLSGIDAIVVCRGGGSMEDLWCFNDVDLANRIYGCSLPVVSGIGHQTDFTIIDYVSDIRCETPTAAATLLIRPSLEVQGNINFLKKGLLNSMERVLQKIDRVLVDANPLQQAQLLLRNLKNWELRLSRLSLLDRAQNLIDLPSKQMRLDDLIAQVVLLNNQRLDQLVNRLEVLQAKLFAMSPDSVLERGYTYVTFGEKVVKDWQSFQELPNASSLSLFFHDGEGHVKKD